MLAAAIFGAWFVQAPLVPPGSPTLLPVTREWSLLGGAFKLKHERFLVWQPIYDPFRGWHAALRPTWLVELAPTHRRLAGLSLAIQSAPAMAPGEVGIVRPRLQYQLPGTQTRVGVELPIQAFLTSAVRGFRVIRPMAFISGRF